MAISLNCSKKLPFSILGFCSLNRVTGHPWPAFVHLSQGHLTFTYFDTFSICYSWLYERAKRFSKEIESQEVKNST